MSDEFAMVDERRRRRNVCGRLYLGRLVAEVLDRQVGHDCLGEQTLERRIVGASGRRPRNRAPFPEDAFGLGSLSGAAP
jgi:hypothetical protein